MRTLLLSFFTFFLPCILFAQKLTYEKLRVEVQNNSYVDSASLFSKGAEAIIVGNSEGHREYEAEITIYYGNHFYYKGDKEKAKKYYVKAKALAKKMKANRFLNLSRIRLCYLRWEEGNEEEVRKEIIEILENAKDHNEPLNQVECYNVLAQIEERHTRFKEAMGFYLKGLRIAEETKDNYYIAVFLNNIGLLKEMAKQYEEALKDFERGVELSKNLNNLRLTAHLYNNIALIYQQTGKKDEAIQQYVNILTFTREYGGARETAIAATNLASIYQQEGEYELAHKYCDTALRIFKENNFVNELSKGYLNIAQLLGREKKYSEALRYTQMAEKITDSTENLEDAVGVHFIKSSIYENQGKLKEALKEYRMYKRLNDSLKESTNTKAITELQGKYNVEKKEAEIQKEKNKNLELENKNLALEKKRLTLERKNAAEKEASRRKILWISVIGIVLVLTTTGYFYASYNRKTRRQQRKFSQQLIHDIEQERNRIAKDLHDDIGQSLSAIKSQVNMSYKKHPEDNQLTNIETDVGKVIEQTREISRKLYPAYLEKIGLTRSVARLMDAVQDSTGLICSFEIDQEADKIEIQSLTHIYRVIQECVNNTIKHANATALKVTVMKEDDEFKLIYQDNGKGIQKSDISSNGIGFMSLKERARMINGELNFGENSGKGFRLIINFKPSFG